MIYVVALTKLKISPLGGGCCVPLPWTELNTMLNLKSTSCLFKIHFVCNFVCMSLFFIGKYLLIIVHFLCLSERSVVLA